MIAEIPDALIGKNEPFSILEHEFTCIWDG